MTIPSALERPHLPVGDSMRHLPLTVLEPAFAKLPAPPKATGGVALLVRRCADGRRETPSSVTLSEAEGVPGDRWRERLPLNPEAQITVMRRDVGELIANGQPLTHFGDNLVVDLDLSADNLPSGTRLRIGRALLEVTPKPHTGCLKYKDRFGADALRFVSTPEALAANLRGIHVRVVEDGEVAVGDAIVVERDG